MGLLQDLAFGKTIKLVNGQVPQVITQTVVPVLKGNGNIISLPSVAEALPSLPTAQDDFPDVIVPTTENVEGKDDDEMPESENTGKTEYDDRTPESEDGTKHAEEQGREKNNTGKDEGADDNDVGSLKV